MIPTYLRTRFRILMLALAVALVAMSAAAQSSVASGAGGVLVQGSGVVMGEPDVVQVVLGVDMVETELADALANADRAMTAVRQALVDGGVAQADIRTAGFDIWREDVRDDQGTVTASRYHVRHNYQVTVRALDRIGTLIPAAVAAGANSVSDITFTMSDPSALQSRARAAAMADARARAEELAKAAGVQLGRPISIEEHVVSQGGRGNVAFARASGGSPIAAGQLAVEIDVSVRYEIR